MLKFTANQAGNWTTSGPEVGRRSPHAKKGQNPFCCSSDKVDTP